MTLAIVTKPEISGDDLGWIEGLRSTHLSGAERAIPPHVTLVFPTRFEVDDNLSMHMLGVAASTQPFEAVFRITAPIVDPMNGGWTVQLLPDQGLSKLMRLHNFLYSGPLADHLSFDVPYVPHMTMARTANGQQAQALCEDLNSNIIEVEAKFTSVELIRIDGDAVSQELAYDLEG